MNGIEIIILAVCCALFRVCYKIYKIVDKRDGDIGWIMCKMQCLDQQMIWIRQDIENDEKFNSREYEIKEDESQDNA